MDQGLFCGERNVMIIKHLIKLMIKQNLLESKQLLVIGRKLSLRLKSFRSTSAAAAPLQSCPTLCDPTDGSPLGSSAPGTLQARALQWAAMSV